MLELWYNSETDEYKLKDDGVEEKLSRMAGDFLRECARNNIKLQDENRRLREAYLTIRGIKEELGVMDYDI